MIKYLALATLIVVHLPEALSAASLELTLIDHPGNPGDVVVINGSNVQFGAVAYPYKIGRFDVTNQQYADFLNAKDPSGQNLLSLYDSRMNDALLGGIKYDSGHYVVIDGNEFRPVTFVSWYDAVRFANWQNNGGGDGDTETGAYTLGPLHFGAVPDNGALIARNPGARIFLPSEDEQFKAAYFSPSTNSYFEYPTGSDEPPGPSGPSLDPNKANYRNVENHPTDVGSYAGSASPFGTFDQGGNVYQWNEALINGGEFRGLRGGAFDDQNGIYLRASSRITKDFDPSSGFANVGFRVAALASVPEPSGIVTMIISCASIFAWHFVRCLHSRARA